MRYTPWRFSMDLRWPVVGSRWWYGSFGLGLQIDSHPRWRNVGFCLLVVEVWLSWERDIDWSSTPFRRLDTTADVPEEGL